MPVLRSNKPIFPGRPIMNTPIEAATARYNPTAACLSSQPEETVKNSYIELLSASGPIHVQKITHYPISAAERKIFRTKHGKSVTSHQWDVYDFVHSIPCGKVTTYKDVSVAVGGSPRSVGNALRNNPFAPYIPCHRVIASNFYVGGFLGEWGTEDKTGTHCYQKLDLLAAEGVIFTKGGHLADADIVIWRGHSRH